MKAYLYSLATDQRKDIPSQIIKLILIGLSFVYQGIIVLRNFLFDRNILKAKHIGRPVISVGNITMGGVGKTPLVIWIARYFIRQGLKPVVLTRGYMDKKNIPSVSDEVALLTSQVEDMPVLVGANRVKNATEYLEINHCDVFILDDGFQRRQAHRDLNIVLIDATNPFGNKHLVPGGILREPLSALKRSDMVVITKTDLDHNSVPAIKREIQDYTKDIPIVESVHHPTRFVDIVSNQSYDLQALKDKEVIAFSGIGNPSAFDLTLKRLGVIVVDHIKYMDHHRYEKTDLKDISTAIDKTSAQAVITTHKDAVKIISHLKDFATQVMWVYLDMTLEIVHEKEKFDSTISRLLRR